MKRPVAALLFPVFGLLLWITAGPAQSPGGEKSRPDLELWSSLKRSLTGPDGEQFFEENLKGFALPVMLGTLISASPTDRPVALVIALSDAQTPEITLRVKDDKGQDAPLNGPLMRNSQIRFEGAVTAFTRNPFMLTVETSPKFGRPRKR